MEILPIYQDDQMIDHFNKSGKTKIDRGCYIIDDNPWGLKAFMKLGDSIKLYYHVKENIYQEVWYGKEIQKVIYADEVTDVFKMKVRPCCELGPSFISYYDGEIYTIQWGDYDCRTNLPGTEISYVKKTGFYKVFDKDNKALDPGPFIGMLDFIFSKPVWIH